MIKLVKSLKAWGSADFERTLKNDIRMLDTSLLPLQAGLSQSSYVSDSDISAVILGVTDTPQALRVKAGIFYAGVIAGSCCADDPTPACENTEYCELQFEINKMTADTTVAILQDHQA